MELIKKMSNKIQNTLNKNRLKYLAVVIIAIIAISLVAVYIHSQNADSVQTSTSVPTPTPSVASSPSPIITANPTPGSTSTTPVITATPTSTPLPTATGTPQPTGTPLPVTTIRISEFSTGNLAVDWAVAKGLFTQASLNVEPWTANSGSAATQAIIAGSSDMHEGDFSLLSSSVANGADLKGFLLDATNQFVVAVKDSSPINSVTDLKGKTVGVSSFGSGSDLSLRALVTKYGLNPDKDLTIIQVGNTGLIPAIEAGTIDAGVTAQSSVDEQGDLKTISVVSLDLPGFGGSVYFTDTAFLNANGPALKRFGQVILLAEQQISADPNSAASFYASKYDVSESEATINVHDTILTWNISPTFGQFGGHEAGLNSTINWMVQLNVIPQAIPLSQIIAYGYAPNGE